MNLLSSRREFSEGNVAASPPAISDAARALEYYRLGRMAEAADTLDARLAVHPDDAEALALLGIVRDAAGDPAGGADLLGRALAIEPTPSRCCNLGMVLGHLGRHAEAIDCFDRALKRRPDYPEALNNLGTSLEALRRPAEAEAAYRRAIAARPGFAAAWSNLGNSLRAQCRMEEAVAAYEQAVACNPAASRAALGAALGTLGRPGEAREAYRHEVARQPDDPEAHANLAQALLLLGRPDEALQASERALTLRPDHPQALTTQGHALRELDRLAESEAVLRLAWVRRPTEVSGYNALAITLQAADRPHEALAVLDLAAGLDPLDAETQHHRAMLLLRQGRFAEGWQAYEWRFQTMQAGRSQAQFEGQPRWRGEPLAGRTILVVPEQGLGDTIQFVRYVPRLAALGGRVLLGVQRPLARLLDGLPGVAQMVGIGEAMPAYDLHCPMLSLPGAFGTEISSIPDDGPYLRPHPDTAARWAARIARRPGADGLKVGPDASSIKVGPDASSIKVGPDASSIKVGPDASSIKVGPDASSIKVGPDASSIKVGIVWAGNPNHIADRQRSLAFSALAPLWQVPGIGWYSLQVGAHAAAWRATPVPVEIDDLAPELTDFAETAAAICALDLVISADTAVAHLAGALGRPVWLMLPEVPDWRWLRRGETSPWYPTMRLFRQDRRHDWMSVTEQVAAALRAHD